VRSLAEQALAIQRMIRLPTTRIGIVRTRERLMALQTAWQPVGRSLNGFRAKQEPSLCKLEDGARTQ